MPVVRNRRISVEVLQTRPMVSTRRRITNERTTLTIRGVGEAGTEQVTGHDIDEMARDRAHDPARRDREQFGDRHPAASPRRTSVRLYRKVGRMHGDASCGSRTV
jgi:hypothetical protein